MHIYENIYYKIEDMVRENYGFWFLMFWQIGKVNESKWMVL